jgi:hypothetical protein
VVCADECVYRNPELKGEAVAANLKEAFDARLAELARGLWGDGGAA